jgi:uncharacterized protein (TIGR02466 family)
MNNVLRDILFTNFLYSCELDVPLDQIESDCYALMNSSDGVQKSNQNGWQSESSKHNDFLTTSAFSVLKQKSVEFGQLVMDYEGLEYNVSGIDAWVNINKKNSYNKPHTHPGSVLVGCFYVKVPEHSGDLSFVRSDASSCALTFANKPAENSFLVTPQVGRLYVFPPWLMHMVTLNESDSDRISIAVNFLVE